MPLIGRALIDRYRQAAARRRRARFRIVGRAEVAAAEADPTLTFLERRVLRTLEHWPIGHPLSLADLSRSLTSPPAGPREVAAAVARLERRGRLPGGRIV